MHRARLKTEAVVKKTVVILLCLLLSFTPLTLADTASAYKVGDIVTLGSWGGEPVEWQILEDMGDGTYILLSVKGLDTVPYHTKDTKVTWEKCSLRAWLNGEFYEKAFSADEKKQLVRSTLKNPDNKTFGTKGGKPTEDYVYLLNLGDVERYYGLNDLYGGSKDRSRYGCEALLCMPSETALRHGAYTMPQESAKSLQAKYSYPLPGGTCCWWLRGPGFLSAPFIDCSGNVCFGTEADTADYCVRPVIRARL